MGDDRHGWLCSQTVTTPAEDFEFINGYPAGDSAGRLRELQFFHRAVEIFQTQMMAVSQIALRQGLRMFGATKPTQVVVWEQLMDAKTLLLTANTETVYAITHLALDQDGPTVIEAPPHMLGFLQDGLQRYLADIGPLGADKGAGGTFLVVPPGFDGKVPEGYHVVYSPTHSVCFAVRGFQDDAGTDAAVALMKQIKVYPLSSAGGAAPRMEFLNGSGRDVDTIFPDDHRYFELLAMLVEEEPADVFGPLERWLMQSIGISKGRPFMLDDKTRKVLDDAARLGAAMARAVTYDSPPEVYFYPGRQWQGLAAGLDYTFTKDGVPQVDARTNVYYMAAGNSPAMMAKNVGQGSQYLWTYRDSIGEYLNGAKTYRLHVPPNIPIRNFWSVVVYDAVSRSELQNGQPLPSISSYTKPIINTDGSIDIAFGPQQPPDAPNWIATVPSRGFFPMFRFYSPTEAYFDKTWQLNDVEAEPDARKPQC